MRTRSRLRVGLVGTAGLLGWGLATGLPGAAGEAYPRPPEAAPGRTVAAAAPARAAAALPPEAIDSFPHLDHAGLFPLCTGCHGGIETGEPDEAYPDPASCTGCHDGVERPRVEWSGLRSQEPHPLLHFDHPDHAVEVAAADEGAVGCQECHAVPGAPRMQVDSLDAARCLDCHGGATAAAEHLDDAPCAVCHVSRASALRRSVSGPDLPEAPVPDDHAGGGFILSEGHGEAAGAATDRCATCHVQQRCASCHVDASQPAVQQVDAARPGTEGGPWPAHYPVPPTHRAPDFLAVHGKQLPAAVATGPADARHRGRTAATCATCHTRDDCGSCHQTLLPEMEVLASARSVSAPGVRIERTLPVSHTDPFFMTTHPLGASADPGSCATCHEDTFCTGCHEGPGPAVFHPDDFVARHGAAAAGATAECASCHDAARFCRDCHAAAGAPAGAGGPEGFHDAEPVWLLRHGQAARQGLESCVGCHRPQTCLRCHSDRGAFRVSPHGPGFDARRAFERSPTICVACHLSSPFGPGGGG